jgi:hypothetical protein
MGGPKADGGIPQTNARARLVLIGGSKPREFPLTARKTSIGSASDNDIFVDAATVSRHHAVIRRRLGGYTITDLESTNGTFLNGSRIANPAALKRGDEIRLGAVRFAFMGARPARRGLKMLSAAAMVGGLFVAGFVAMRYSTGEKIAIAPCGVSSPVPSISTSLTPSAKLPARPAPAPANPGPPWLALLNWYRRLSALEPVVEEPKLSAGDRAHVHYLLANYSDALRSGTMPGEQMHQEREGSPGYTPEGAAAGKQSDVDFIYWRGHKPDGLVNFAILDWISGAFHRLPLLNPGLKRVGYYDFCGGGLCVAALNAMAGAEPSIRGRLFAHPIRFPPDGAKIDLRTFSNEWPDPLTSCDGYAPPTGLPITLSLGSFVPARLGSFRLERVSAGGSAVKVEACGFDSDSYSNPDANAQNVAREVLKANSTVVIISRSPLIRGDAYRVEVEVNGTAHRWSFTVAN